MRALDIYDKKFKENKCVNSHGVPPVGINWIGVIYKCMKSLCMLPN